MKRGIVLLLMVGLICSVLMGCTDFNEQYGQQSVTTNAVGDVTNTLGDLLHLVDSPNLPEEESYIQLRSTIEATKYDISKIYKGYEQSEEHEISIQSYYDNKVYYVEKYSRNFLENSGEIASTMDTLTICSYDVVTETVTKLYQTEMWDKISYSLQVNNQGIFWLRGYKIDDTVCRTILYKPHDEAEFTDITSEVGPYEEGLQVTDQYLSYFIRENGISYLYCYDIESETRSLIAESKDFITNVYPILFNDRVIAVEKTSGSYIIYLYDVLTNYYEKFECPEQIQDIAAAYESNNYITVKSIVTLEDKKYYCTYLINKFERTIQLLFSTENVIVFDSHFLDSRNMVFLSNDYNVYRYYAPFHEYYKITHSLGLEEGEVSNYAQPLCDGKSILLEIPSKQQICILKVSEKS